MHRSDPTGLPKKCQFRKAWALLLAVIQSSQSELYRTWLDRSCHEPDSEVVVPSETWSEHPHHILKISNIETSPYLRVDIAPNEKHIEGYFSALSSRRRKRTPTFSLLLLCPCFIEYPFASAILNAKIITRVVNRSPSINS